MLPEVLYLYNMEIKIYKLIDPNSLEIRYVGKTTQPLGIRLSRHLDKSKRSKKKTHKENWICSLISNNQKPIIELIEIVSEINWQEKERFWISQFNNLTNLTEGGEGTHGYIYSESERLDKSILMNTLIKQGKIEYKERAKKISASSKGKKLKETTKQKLRELNIGKKQSVEQKLKTSKSCIRINLSTGEVEEFDSLTLARDNTPNSYKGNISSACSGRLKSYKGFVFKYKNEDIVQT